MNSLDKTLHARFQTSQAARSLSRPSVPREFPSGPTSAAVKVNPARDLIAAYYAVKAERGSVDDVLAKIKR